MADVRGASSLKLMAEWRRTKVLPPSPKDLLFRSAKGEDHAQRICALRRPHARPKIKVVTQTVGTQTLIPTDAGALPRHTVVASVGAAETPAQNQPHPPRRSDKLLPPSVPHRPDNPGHEHHQPQLQQRGSGRLPADRRDPRHPRPATGRLLLHITSPPKYRADAEPESPVLGTLGALHIAAEFVKGKKAEIHKKTKTPPHATEEQ